MRNIIVILTVALLLSSCKKITDVIDREPPNHLVPENVAKNAEGLRNLLNGAYAILHSQYYYMVLTEAIPGAMGGTMESNGFLLNEQFQDNAVQIDLADVRNCWLAVYQLVNQSNWVIRLADELPEGEMTPHELASVKAQAMTLRAMAHFDALRFFGEFYNESSEYGIIVRTSPADFSTRDIKRSTVAETYRQILADLDYAVENAPDFTKPIFISKTAAKALKAKVLLYKGDYATAATLANEVITSGKRKLSTTYAKVFSDGFNSTEMIFMRATDQVSYTADRKRFTYGSRHAIASAWFKTFMTGDPRIAATYAPGNSAILKVNNTTHFSPTYFLRLAEMYLIKAEGLARSGAPLEEAEAPLDSVRSRAYGAPLSVDAAGTEELLNEIYEEIVRELAFENGSEWFAGIRFSKIMEIKPTVTSTEQYILPVPEAETMSNPSFGPQNPGYQ